MSDDDKAKTAFEAHASGGPGTTKWDELPEAAKSAWRTAVTTSAANDPKLVNTHATGTVGSMVGTNPNVNPSAPPPATNEAPAKERRER